MTIVADALCLPLRGASVDAVISNPPYYGNGVWERGYWRKIDAVLVECRRVLRPGGTGWFLLRDRQRVERWLKFDGTSSSWAHEGHTDPPVMLRPGTYWGIVPDAAVAAMVLGNTRPGDVVLDPFAGAGHIPKMAARLGRVPVGMDIDPVQLERGGRY